jgi:hypothetical protein
VAQAGVQAAAPVLALVLAQEVSDLEMAKVRETEMATEMDSDAVADLESASVDHLCFFDFLLIEAFRRSVMLGDRVRTQCS